VTGKPDSRGNRILELLCSRSFDIRFKHAGAHS